MESFKAKLQLTLNELSKAKSIVEQERSENSELHSRIQELQQLLELSKDIPELLKQSDHTQCQFRIQELEAKLGGKSDMEKDLDEERKQNLKLQKQLDETDSGQLEEMDDLQDQLDRERISRSHLENQLQEMEQLLDDQKLENESVQQRLNCKVKSLYDIVKNIQLYVNVY